jgi:hypothetical protein
MASKKQDVARAKLARKIHGLSTSIGRLRSDWQWESQAVDSLKAAEIGNTLAALDLRAFKLAQDIASGLVPLNLADEPRPLFDRPPSSEAESKADEDVFIEVETDQSEPLAWMRPGKEFVQCSRCNKCREIAGARCPDCKNPEYGLVHLDDAGRIADGWKSATPAKPSKPKARAKTEATP